MKRTERMLTSPNRWKALLFFAFLLTFGSAGAAGTLQAQSTESQSLEIYRAPLSPLSQLRTQDIRA
jgi:hypothetical protein